ncbi:MAG TPA: glycosyltransferase family 4 protein, partial [Phycisphaerales bacterium]|nr:glycosyltransferase family 4 protein [Phycisphaerales bacterium]
MKANSEHAATSMRERKPRVVMLLANEFVHDTRVYKEARSLIEWGCDVTVIAAAAPHVKKHEVQDDITVLRVENSRWNLVRLAVGLSVWWCRPALRLVMSPSHPVREEGPASQDVSEVNRKSSPTANLDAGVSRCIEGAAQRPSLAHIAMDKSRGVYYRARNLARRAIRAPRRLIPAVTRTFALNVQLARTARGLQPDVIHSHDLNTLIAGGMVKRMNGAKLVYDSHELWLERNIGNGKRWKDRLAWTPVERGLIGRCDAVISVAEGICVHLAERYGIPKPTLIRNVQPYEPPASRSKLLSNELGIPEHLRVVL